MATGIVSVGMDLDHLEAPSRALLALAVATWLALGAVFLARLMLDRGRWLDEARQPSALTAVAGTAVVGTRLTMLGWSWAGWALLALATALWVALRRLVAPGRPRTGADFLLAVAPQSLAVLAASLANQVGSLWPAVLALVPVVVGLLEYGAVVARFDLTELRDGLGDQWVAGGALAISTLALAEITRALELQHAWGQDAARVVTVALWAMTVAWLPLLIGAEVRWPRPRYDVRRWATVFPLAMYAVMSVTTGQAAGLDALVDVGRATTWIAFAAWCAAAVGVARRAAARARPASATRAHG